MSDPTRDNAIRYLRAGRPVCRCECACLTLLAAPARVCGLCLEGLHEGDETSAGATLDKAVVEEI